ncbi:MAG: tryptophan synthase subunit alpha [Deferribacteres bacterium]|nr:tryptophan synthase subunit alpha [Deferribacteres bacterium]
MKGLYLLGGYPDMKTFDEALEIALDAGFDFIEVGVPFSDPVADGPVIARAALGALKKGVNLKLILDYLKGKRLGERVDLYIMTYSNILWAANPGRLSGVLKECGVKGCIVADLPNEEHPFFKRAGFELPLVSFATPESREEDLLKLAEVKEAFIYFVSVRGTTGGSFCLDADTQRKLLFLKERAKVPVVLGFGIKSREDVEKALTLAHGFVIGTKAIELLSEDIKAFERWCREIAG